VPAIAIHRTPLSAYDELATGPAARRLTP
jgi:hypothetical protein